MGYRLGVDLGTTYTSAAVARAGVGEPVSLGDHGYEIPSIVVRSAAGQLLFGAQAVAEADEHPDRAAREFKRRIGDRTGFMLGGTPMSAHALAGELLRWVVAQVARGQGSGPVEVVLTCPANWGPFRRELMDQVVSISGLPAARICTEPEAAALHFASTGRLHEGDAIAVYDLGGGTFDAAVLRLDRQGFTFVGKPEGIEQLGGLDFDDAVFAHVRQSLELPEDLPDELLPAVRKLRRECVEAKEKLSYQTAVTIHVGLAGEPASVRITRAEFEGLISLQIGHSIECLERAVDHAGLSAGDLAAVVLVGGSARIPLVSEQVSRRLGRPVAPSPHPKLCVALGAALLPDLTPARPLPVSPIPSAVPYAVPPEPAPAAPPYETIGGSREAGPLEARVVPTAARGRPAAVRSGRSAGYTLAAVILLLVGVGFALLGPTTGVSQELRWNVEGTRTAALPAKTPAGSQLTPTLLGVELPGDPMKLDQATRTFEIGSGYVLFLAGPVVGVVEPPGTKVLLTRSGGAWWSPFATIPGGAMILGILFGIAYAESLLRELRSQRGRIRAGQLTGMIGVGVVVGLVAVLATWLGGRLLTPVSAILVVVSIAASAGLLAIVAQPSAER